MSIPTAATIRSPVCNASSISAIPRQLPRFIRFKSLRDLPRREQASPIPAQNKWKRVSALNSSTTVRILAAAASAGVPLSESLKGVTIFRSDGAEVPVLSLWEGRKCLVAWVRHYGCLLCRKRAALLASKKAELDAAGVALAVIGPANVQQAATFLEQTEFPGEVYADPSQSSFTALQFAYGVASVINPKMVQNALNAQQQGFQTDWALSMQPKTVVSGIWQQGGVLVAGPGADNVLFFHKDKEAGDEPNVGEVLAACCQPAGAA